MTDWEDIESAPKESKVLLHGFGEDGRRIITTGRWDQDKYNTRSKPHFHSTEIRTLWGLRYLREVRWTHWAPLSPPEGT